MKEIVNLGVSPTPHGLRCSLMRRGEVNWTIIFKQLSVAISCHGMKDMICIVFHVMTDTIFDLKLGIFKRH